MKVLVFETNLMWSSRLMQSLRKLGHAPTLTQDASADPDAPVAIVNLGETSYDPAALTSALQSHGTVVIAHAGHKEKDLMELGKRAGCDILASNRQLTFKLEELLQQAVSQDQPQGK